SQARAWSPGTARAPPTKALRAGSGGGGGGGGRKWDGPFEPVGMVGSLRWGDGEGCGPPRCGVGARSGASRCVRGRKVCSDPDVFDSGEVTQDPPGLGPLAVVHGPVG